MTSDTDVKRVDDIWAALKNKSGATADTQRRAELALASSRTSDVPSTSRPSAAPSNANSVAKYLDASLAKLLPQNPIPSAARAAGKPAAAMPLANAPPHSIPSSLPSPASSELIPSGPISLQKEIDVSISFGRSPSAKVSIEPCSPTFPLSTPLPASRPHRPSIIPRLSALSEPPSPLSGGSSWASYPTPQLPIQTSAPSMQSIGLATFLFIKNPLGIQHR